MLIKAKHLKKSYIMGMVEIKAVRDVNLEIEENAFVSIMGPSGSGKSTLMYILGCLDRPDSGEYYLNDKPVNEIYDDDLSEIRNKYIGFVFQTFNLLPRMNALDNVQLPLVYRGVSAENRKKKAIKALKDVGMEYRKYHSPNKLSGGERQKVAIARALVTEPAIIIADEPTGNLDSKSGEEILKLFTDLHKRGKTIIMVTHQREVAETANRIYHIKDGEIIDKEIVRQV